VPVSARRTSCGAYTCSVRFKDRFLGNRLRVEERCLQVFPRPAGVSCFVECHDFGCTCVDEESGFFASGLACVDHFLELVGAGQHDHEKEYLYPPLSYLKPIPKKPVVMKIVIGSSTSQIAEVKIHMG
jgi:hypothetical protein